MEYTRKMGPCTISYLSETSILQNPVESQLLHVKSLPAHLQFNINATSICKVFDLSMLRRARVRELISDGR